MKKQITLLLFTLLFALTSSHVMAQQDILYLIQDGTNDSDYSSNGGSLVGQDPVIKMFESDANFTISYVKIDQAFVVTAMGPQVAGANAIASPINFTDFELVIVSENLASSNTIFKLGNPLHPDQLTKPVIYAKAYALRGSSSALVTSSSAVTQTQNLSMTVADVASPIFNGITVSSGSTINLFRTTADDKGNEGPKAIDIVNDLEISSTTTLLATVPQITNAQTGVGINYFPTGTQVGTTTDGIFAADAISFPFSWGAMVKKDGGNITSEFLTIWRNAAYMLTSQTPPSTLYVNPVYDDYEIITQTTTYDFRDGSIIPNHTDGYEISTSAEAAAQPSVDRFKSADGRVDYRHIAGDNYHGATYGLDMKVGSRVFIKPLGTSVVKVPLSEYSSLDFSLKMANNNSKSFIKVNGAITSASSTTTYLEITDATATATNDLNEFITIDFYATVGNSQNLEFTADATNGGTDIYLPYIEVTYQILQALPQEIVYVQNTAKTIASGSSSLTDDPIIRMFQADSNFNITVIQDDGSGSTLTDITGYDLVILQESMGSGKNICKPGGVLAIRNLTVPTIYNKSYNLKNGKGVITTDAQITESTNLFVTVPSANQTNTLFSGIDFTSSDDVQMFAQITNDDGSITGTPAKGIQVGNGLESTALGTCLAFVGTDATDADNSLVINDFPALTQLGQDVLDVLPSRMIAFTFNHGAQTAGDGANITSEQLTIWRNAAYTLTGLSVPSTLYVNPDYVTLAIAKVGEVSAVSSNVRAIGNRVYVSNVKLSTEVNIYSITGALVKSFKTNEDTNFQFSSGLWIATVKTLEGVKAVKFITN